ncbi:MAG: hypothetical protein NVS9B10_17290 [Nevskia sp.]
MRLAGGALLLGGLAACSKAPSEPADTSVWIQQTEIAIKAPDARACVLDGIGRVAGLKVDAAASTARTIHVGTPLAETVPGVHIEAVLTDHAAVDLQFVGHGKREPDEARVAISPKLRELGNAVMAACAGP